MADTDQSLNNLRYNQVSRALEGFGGGSPQWTQLTLTNVDPTQVPATRLINTTAPLTGGGNLSADRTLSMPVATAIANGYLSSADWSTFNGKLSTAVQTLHADANPNLTGNVQLVSGTNITLSQVGQAITIDASGGGSGITQLTGDVTAGPGSGSQAASIASGAVTPAKISVVPTDDFTFPRNIIATNAVTANGFLQSNGGSAALISSPDGNSGLEIRLLNGSHMILNGAGMTNIVMVDDNTSADPDIPDMTSVLVDMVSTTDSKAFVVPRVSNQSNVSTPADGMIIFDKNLSLFVGYHGGSWHTLG